MVSNQFVRDVRLSFHARGVGLWLLSHVDGWECTTERIAQEAGVGRDQIRRALRELEKACYLRRTRERLTGGKLGPMFYEVQCVPFEPVEEETPGQDQRLETQALVDQALADNQHKKTNSKKITEEDQPSGRGVPPAPEPNPSTEEDVRRVATADQPGLFEAPAAPEAPKKKRRDPAEASDASAVLASFITSYSEHHNGRRPLGSDIGKVGRAAKLILSRAEATLEDLITCAARMGRGEYSDLFRELNFSRPATGGAAIPARRDDEGSWADMAAATAARLREIAGVPA